MKFQLPPPDPREMALSAMRRLGYDVRGPETPILAQDVIRIVEMLLQATMQQNAAMMRAIQDWNDTQPHGPITFGKEGETQ